MFYQLTVKVNGNTFVKIPYQLKLDPYIIAVKCDDNKKVNELSIKRKIVDYDKYVPIVNMNIQPNQHSMNIPDSPFDNELINLLQLIEGFGSFWFHIKRIYWETPIMEWILEMEAQQLETQEKVKIGYGEHQGRHEYLSKDVPGTGRDGDSDNPRAVRR